MSSCGDPGADGARIRPSALTVTRERPDGDQTSSVEKVLVGTVQSGG